MIHTELFATQYIVTRTPLYKAVAQLQNYSSLSLIFNTQITNLLVDELHEACLHHFSLYPYLTEAKINVRRRRLLIWQISDIAIARNKITNTRSCQIGLFIYSGYVCFLFPISFAWVLSFFEFEIYVLSSRR